MLKKKGQKKETRDPGRYVKGDFDISACSVDCFSWNRHGDMSLEKIAFSPFLRWIPTLALRIRNFLWRGANERILICRKIS